MRADLTANFITQLTAQGRAPVQLGVFDFPQSGKIYIADRPLGAADGLLNTYQGVVEDWGALEDVIGDSYEKPSAATRQFTLVLFNGGTPPFSDYFLSQDPENVFFDLYQWFLGIDETDKALIDTFTIQDPITFDERNRLIMLDLVSVGMRFNGLIGYPLTSNDYPTAKTDDIGKSIDLIIGNPGQVKAVCSRTAPEATLNGSILSNSLIIATNENLDDLGFSISGIIQIGEEKIRYSTRAAYTFTVVQRGYLSEAAEHLDRDPITEHIADFTYLLGQGPMGAISDVKVGGYDAPAGIYTTYPELNPSRIVFNEKPYYYRFAIGSSFLEMHFDAVNADNTALWPYRAYDAASDATAARIDSESPKLSLLQATSNPSRGEIVKAYLAVEHWANKQLINDYAEVTLSGVGVVGRLSIPNEADTLEVEAEVDIDHGHNHSISGEHVHTFQNPAYRANTTDHAHASNLTGPGTTINGNPSAFQLLHRGESAGDDYQTVNFIGLPSRIAGGILSFNMFTSVGVVKVKEGTAKPGYNEFEIGPQIRRYSGFFTYWDTQAYFWADVWNVKLVYFEELAIEPANVSTSIDAVAIGRNYDASDKAQTDVETLATENRLMQVTTAETSTHSHVNLFDITDQVNFDWAWFDNRSVSIEYKNNQDNGNIYILHAFFDVEYRKRERLFSDDISATVSGLIDDETGTITGTASAPITRPDHLYQYILTSKAGYPQTAIDSATFADTGARFAALGYVIDGVLAGDQSAKEALKKIAYQTRSRYHFNAGKIKLSLIEKLESWPTGREITADDLQLKSFTATRQPVVDIVNYIDLFFAKNWTSEEDGAAAYSNSLQQYKQSSIDQHGKRQNGEQFLFDLIRSPSMAADLIDYYIDRLSTPSTYYDFSVYLKHFDLERNDFLQVTYENFHRLRKAKMMIVAISRIFGSGKNNAINQFRITGEVLRYFLFEATLPESVLLSDALTVSKGFDLYPTEALIALDALTSVHVCTFPQAVLMADLFITEMIFNVAFAESVTPSDVVSIAIGVEIAEQITLIEDVALYRHFGFGGGQYSAAGFGGYVIWRNRAPDTVQAADSLIIELKLLPDGDAVTITESIIFSSGFGCPVGAGFGLTYYGN